MEKAFQTHRPALSADRTLAVTVQFLKSSSSVYLREYGHRDHITERERKREMEIYTKYQQQKDPINR
jgi:hypothetical protein